MKKKWLEFAEVLDSFRVVPRIILGLYGYFVFYITEWYMNIPDPSNQQMGLITAVIGVAAFVVQIYSNSGRKW